MTAEKNRRELDEKALGAAAGGKPQHVFVPHVEKIRDMPDASGDLFETGDCGGGIDPPVRRTDDAAPARPSKKP